MQPIIKFPSRSYGATARSFQSRWYKAFNWIEYSVERNAAFCFPCRFFCISPNADNAFIMTGFSDWKHATGKSGSLTSHNNSATHRDAMMAWKQYQLARSHDATINTQLGRQGAEIIRDNRHYITCIVESILYCAQQGIALRGHQDSMDDDSQNPGNFKCTIKLLSRHDELLHKRIKTGPSNVTWLGHEIQNEVIQVLGKKVLSMITAEVHEAGKYTIIVDETKDVSKREQLSIALRYCHNSNVCERFVGFFHAAELNATALSEFILAKLADLHIDIKDCVSQCYDGASVMSGRCAGVAKKIRDKNSKALYAHCHAHRLNLVLVDVTKKVTHAANFFVLMEELYVFMSSSVPHSKFLSMQSQLGSHREIRLKKLSDTRWSCRHESIKAVVGTLTAVICTLEEITEIDDDSVRRVKANGLLLQVKQFHFVLALLLFQKIPSITAKLSDLLQAERLNYAAAASCIEATMETIHELRTEEKWKEIWEEAVVLATKNGVAVANLPRRRAHRLPERLNDTIVTETTGLTIERTAEEYQFHLYYAVIDEILGEMKRRFDSENISLLKAMQGLLPDSDNFLKIEVLLPFLQHYEIDCDEVAAEISTATKYLQQEADSSELQFMHHVHKKLSLVPEAFPKLLECFKVALTVGVSTATAERSFSSLRRIKNYLDLQ